MILSDLLWGFLKVGCFAFGGAYGAIPLIRDVVLSYGWLSDEALTDMIAVSESTPGPIMVNLATYIGKSQAGLLGAAVATAAVVLPSFAVILLLTEILKNTVKNRYVQAVLRGLKPCLAGIVLATGASMLFSICCGSLFSPSPDGKNAAFVLFLLLVLYGSRFFLHKKLSPILLIILSAIAGIAVF